MVGVGGRSKGCQTCRERHVKCDETHPTCKRCEKANITCGGYHRPRVWVDETPRLKRAISGDNARKNRTKEKAEHARAQAGVTTPSSISLPTGSPISFATMSPTMIDLSGFTPALTDTSLNSPPVPDMFGDSPFMDAGLGVWDPLASPAPLITDEMILDVDLVQSPTDTESVSDIVPFNDLTFKMPAAMTLSAFEDAMHVSFTLSRLFFGTPTIYSFGQPKSWLSSATQLPNAPTVVKEAVQCLSAVFFGKMHHQQDIVKRGSLMYGKALASLNKTLRDPSEAWGLGALVSAMSLGVYELVASTTPLAWLHHASGTAKLIELRGPSKHKKGLDRAVYLTNRAVIAISALANRKQSFLAKPEWKTVPWEDDPETKTSKDKLVDILVDVPGLVADCDAVYCAELAGPLAIAKRAQISEQTGELMARLIEWRLGFEKEFPHTAFEVACDPATSMSVDDAGPLFDTILHYAGLSEAADIALYNSILLMLLNINQFITGKPFVFDKQTHDVERTNSLILPGESSDFRLISLEICRSLEYHLLPVHLNAGSFFTLFPARVAYYALDKTSREAMWIEKILGTVADVSGFEVSRTILMDYPTEAVEGV